jgi:hypothetical protein
METENRELRTTKPGNWEPLGGGGGGGGGGGVGNDRLVN